MKFFDRKSEIAELRDIRRKSRKSARFTVVVGAYLCLSPPR